MFRSLSTASTLLLGTALLPLSGAWAQSTQEATEPAATPTTAELPRTGADQSAVEPEPSEIVVTGSRIRRDPNDSALPLQIITTQELTRNAISNPEQLISYLTTNGSGADNLASNTDVVGGQQRGNNGASFANLRGQGSGATLILLNGRRVAAHGLQGSAVDVNQIPFGAIERVEVLKEGASAIYGTDAIGGVINFILRKDYQGLGVQGFIDHAEEGDHTITRTSAIAGFGDLRAQNFNVMGAVSYSTIPELRGDSRDFVNLFQPQRGLSPDTRGTPFATIFPLAGTFFLPNPTSPAVNTRPFPNIPGTSTPASGGLNVLDLPGGLGCGSIEGQGPYDEQLWATPSAGLACAWDTARAAVLQQPLQTLTWLGRGVVRFGEHEVFAEVTGSDATAAKRFSNVQITPNTTTQNYQVRPGEPGYAFVYSELLRVFPELASRPQAGFAYRWRCIECGRREIVTDTKTSRYALGVDGPLFAGWDYRVGGSRATSESKSELGTGYHYRGTLANGQYDPNAPLVPGSTTNRGLIGLLNSGLINPFLRPGETQSAAALAALDAVSARGVVLYGGRYTVNQVDASVSGPLFQLPGGTVQAAVGLDWRKEQYKFNGDERAAANRPFIIAAPFDDVNALSGVSRTIRAAYAEVLLPIIDGLDVTVAGRFDDYGDFGNTFNPLVNFKYRPMRALMFRGNYNTAFRVPAFNQLFNGVLESLYTGTELADPRTCPTGRPSSAPGCESLTRTIDILNGGNLDLEPETAKMYSLGAVFEPSRNFSASVDFFSIRRNNTIIVPTLRQIVDFASFFEDRFIRDPSGVLTDIDQRWANSGGTRTEGFEFVARGGLEALGGRVSAGFDGTLLTKRDVQVVDGAPVQDLLGVFSFSDDLGIRWKHNAFVGFSRGQLDFTLTQLYRGSYENQQLPGILNGTVTRPDTVDKVDPYIIYNLAIGVRATERLRFNFGVKNLFDRDPPFAISYDSFTGGGSSWEPRVADPRGRAFTFNVDVKFF